MPKLHPRTLPVAAARSELKTLVLQFIAEHELTFGEALGMLADIMDTLTVYLVRQERHPDDPEKQGDEK